MKILIVGHRPPLLTSLKSCFAAAGYDVLTVDNTVIAMGIVMAKKPDLVVQQLGDRGPDACWQIRSISSVPLIALGDGSESERLMAIYRGADVCLPVSVECDLLLAHSRALLRRAGFQRSRLSLSDSAAD